MRELLSNFRFSLRLLRKQPAFVFLATTCLALGIGANASIFSLLNALLLRSLPIPAADRVVVLHHGKHFGFSFPDYQDLAFRFQNSGSLFATVPTESSLDRAGYQGQLVTAEAVTGNYARVLELGTALGDWFDREDEPVAVISYHAWQDFFHGDPRALGQQVRSETQWYTVVGVASKEFDGLSLPRSTSIWVPLHIWTRQHPSIQARLEHRDSPLVTVFARLSGSIQDSDATAQLRVIDAELSRQTVRRKASGDPIRAETVRGVTSNENRTSVKRVMVLLFAVVGLLLLICCLNVGNLLLVRGAARQQEVAIRYSLGATRGRIVRQFLSDSFLIAVVGGVGGLVVDVSLVRLVLRLVPALPLGETISPHIPVDWRVIVFVGTSALSTVFVFGLLPAWKASSTGLANRVSTSPGTAQGMRLRKSSVVAQVAFSFVLLVAAGLFLDACWRLQQADPGFAVRNRVYATTYVSTPEFKPDQIPGFYQKVLTDVRSIPNVRSAALTYLLPLTQPGTECVQRSDSGEVYVAESIVSPGFLHTMAIPLREGRDFTNSDRADAQNVVLVNRTLAETLWPNASALGRRIHLGCGKPLEATIVGVVGASKTALTLPSALRPQVYRPFAQSATGLASIVVETSGPSGPMMEQLRRTLLNEGRGMRVYAVDELSRHVEQSFWQLRWEAWLLGAFGITALLLAALGLYGIVSYSTALRTREFGIRIALGAQSRDIAGIVAREAMTLAIIGSLIGTATAFAVARLLRAYLLSEQMPVAFASLGVGALWLIIVAIACYLPARRSARLEPSVTLRHE